MKLPLFRFTFKEFRRAALAVGMLTIGFSPALKSAPMASRPLEISDLVGLATMGQALPMGDRIVWEQAPAYDRIGYYGLGHIGAWRESGLQLRTFSWDGDRANAQFLFDPEPATSYWLGSVSPGNRYVAFYAAERGSFYTGIFDEEERCVRRFDVAPDVLGGWETVWLSEEEFIFAACAEGRQPLAGARPYTAARRADAWDRSWRGDVAVDVAESAAPALDSQWLPGRLFKVNARTGTLQQLAEGVYGSLAVSADGRYLAALHEGTLGTSASATVAGDWVWSRTRLVVFDLTCPGPPTVLADGREVMKGSLTWAPDANRLAFFAWDSGKSLRTGIFWSWDAATNTFASHPHAGLDLASARERGTVQFPEQPVWIDGRLAVCARPHAGAEPRFTYRDITRPGMPGYPGKSDWFVLTADGAPVNLTRDFKEVSAVPVSADGRSLTLLADGNLWQVRLDAAPRAVTQEPAPLAWPALLRPQAAQRARFPDTAVFEVREGERPAFVLVHLASGRVVRIPFTRASDRALGVSADGGVVLFRSLVSAGTNLSIKTAAGQEQVLEQLNQHLGAIAVTHWQTITYRVQTRHGERMVRGRLLLPPDYRAERRYPTIIHVYPGTSHVVGDADFAASRGIGVGPGSYSDHLLAAKGYVVFLPNTATDYIRAGEAPLGTITSLVEQGVQALVEQGYTDPDRVALLGISQGGFASLLIASESQRFKAVISLNGWVDMYSHYFESYYLSEFVMVDFRGAAVRYEPASGGDFNIGRSPYDAPEAYVRNSPLFRAKTMTTPTMLIHSDMDVFAMSHYERMFTALSLQHRRAQLVRYWGEGHTPSSPGNIRDMNSRIFAWLDEHCDVARDRKGALIWDQDRAQSRRGAPALSPDIFLRWDAAATAPRREP